jgi:hypothetical protein
MMGDMSARRFDSVAAQIKKAMDANPDWAAALDDALDLIEDCRTALICNTADDVSQEPCNTLDRREP